MRVSLLAMLLMFSCSMHAQEYYEWRDANGTLHFSDTPPERSYTTHMLATPELSQAAQASSELAASELSSSQNSSDPQKSVRASQVFLVAPENKQTVRDNTGKVAVSLGCDQPLAKGQTLRVILDGQAQPASTKVVQMLENVDRGEHVVSVDLLDDGKVIFSSPKHIFYMHRTIAKKKAREHSQPQ
ncbi:MAG: DUF4124 domain-containing protein [Vibrionaceae bacterium]